VCLGATQDRQDALKELLKQKMELLLVVGGYNSSNTSHLAEIGENVLPTYFIKNATKMESPEKILHFNQHKGEEEFTENWLPEGEITVGITAGASCPNNLIEDAIRRLFEFRGMSAREVLEIA
jgi:4-hydroxy-3-methylbut-2-enyl diphosphate reductase